MKKLVFIILSLCWVVQASFGQLCSSTETFGGGLSITTTTQTYNVSAGAIYNWTFSGVTNNVYTFSSCLASEDTYLRIYDSNKTFLKSVDDNGPSCSGSRASIEFSPTSNGIYFVELARYSCATLTSSFGFTYSRRTVTPPTITGFNPVPATVGSVVSILGTNLSQVSSVYFTGVSYGVSPSIYQNYLLVTVPNGAVTGTLTLTGAFGALTTPSLSICNISASVNVTSTNMIVYTFDVTGGVPPYRYSLDNGTLTSNNQFVNVSQGTHTAYVQDQTGCGSSRVFAVNSGVECNTLNSSGGQGTTFTPHNLGAFPGQVSVDYEMYSVPDQMDIYYNGQMVASTGGLVSNAGKLTFYYNANPGEPTICNIRMYAPLDGTAWNYQANCPEGLNPTVTSFTPRSGSSGTYVVITGTKLSGATGVKFNGVDATSFTVSSNTTIYAYVPAGATTGRISVVTPQGTAVSSYDFVIGSAPSISSIYPTSGVVGSTVYVNGVNFTNLTSVKFGSINATYSVTNSNQLAVVVPAGFSSSTISVTNSSGSSTSSSVFTVGVVPVVSSFSPGSGISGTQVTLTGSGFSSASQVNFGGISAPFSIISPTRIVTTVPANAVTAPISIINSLGSGVSSNSFVINSPAITSFVPQSGYSGQLVSIFGANFSGITSVKFNGVNAASFTQINPTLVTAFTPSSFSTGPISFVYGSGTVTSSNLFCYGSCSNSTPFITSLSTTQGMIGSTVSIFGSNFFNINSVNIGGVSAAFRTINSGLILMTVPGNVSSGAVTVVNSLGSGSYYSFTVVSPVINGINPLFGNAGSGVLVTITGVNFAGITNVLFSSTPASTYTVVSSTRIIAQVPNSSFSPGKITVVSSNGSAVSVSTFCNTQCITSSDVEYTFTKTSSGISVFPNPSNELFYLHLGDNSASQVEVYDSYGQRLSTYPMEGLNNRAVSILGAPGAYVLKILMENGKTEFMKVIKE
ncbi:MAG: IPT/TIG domain-containing protein [Cytophagales bacterium]|nr:IPT/TIG domain-containing protein [Cytophagales bacterium]